MPQGKYKRRQAGGQFKKGNKKQLQSNLSRSVTATESASNSGSNQNNVNTGTTRRGLRHRKDLESKNDEQSLGNRIINLNLLISMMNSVYAQHSDRECKNFRISLKKEVKKGLGSRLQFHCISCDFVSTKMDTFTKLPDSKGGAINMMLASALQDTSIGIEKANLLLTQMDIPVISRSHSQTLMNKASVNTVRLNESDMAEKRQAVIQHNIDKGEKNPRHVDISFDGRYNANRMTSSYKPGQAASQAYGVAIENHTSYKYIIDLAVQNKLCWTGAYLRNKGFKVTCPGGHAECTSNLPYMTPMSEKSMAFDIAKRLSEEDIVVRTLTTDGDTAAHLGMKDLYDQLGNAWKVNRQADPNHLGSRQVRKTRNSAWSQTLFRGEKLTGSVRQQAISALAKDIKARCNAVIEKLRLHENGLIENIKRLPDIQRATLECYAGNCSYCLHDSIVCSGTGGVGDWWYHSKFLPTHGIHHLKMTSNDKQLMSAILEIRLSESAVLSVSSNTSTQKNEAFNRAVASTAPKDINMSRNFASRVASKALQMNNSLQASVEKKVKSITGKSLSPRPQRYLESASRRSEEHKTYQKSPTYRLKRKKIRAKLENEYHEARTSGQYTEEYSKGQCDEPGPSKQCF